MKNYLLIAVAAMMASLSTWAQRLEVVDANGQGIPLVSVLADNGVLIGTTDLNGVVADVKGAQKVAVTHVAYKPQLVTVADLPLLGEGPVAGRRVVMDDLDYDIEEIVVKPKPYIYVETYYRFYAFIDDSLRYYQAGIMPNAYDIEKQKVETGSTDNSSGYFCPAFGASITWGVRASEYHAGRIHTSAAKELQPGGKISQKYFSTLTDVNAGRQCVICETDTMGFVISGDGQCCVTVDGARMQMYRNKVLGQDKQLQRREEKNYDYQFTEVFSQDEDGNSSVADFVMDTNHWEWDGGKGRMKMIIETYATARGYMDKNEWKEKKKELKRNYKYPMSLNQLEAYATQHNIPALTPTFRSTVERLKKK